VVQLGDLHSDCRARPREQGPFACITADADRDVEVVQKPNPQIFQVALDGLGVAPPDALMVGDRASHDGAAVNLGIPTVLLPELTATSQRRLSVVLRACGIPSA
jgi:FMN phosphatase YigB (HAD superfamily)